MSENVVQKSNLTSSERPKDCLACRIVSGTGLLGIAAYLANISYRSKTLAGKVVISAFSLTFVSLGVARFRQTFPFQKKIEAKN